MALNVAWSAPTNVGKSSISAYDLRYILSATTDKSDSGWTVTEDVWTSTGGGALEHEIDGLLVDTQYDVQVRAVNNDGDGQWSAVEYAAASTDKAPFIESLTPGNGSLSFSWSAPTSSELGTVTSYDLRYIRSDVRNKACRQLVRTHVHMDHGDTGVFPRIAIERGFIRFADPGGHRQRPTALVQRLFKNIPHHSLSAERGKHR